MKKQTAVEWYNKKLIQIDIDFGGHKNYWVERNKAFEQAKAMEKEQIMDAHYQGYRNFIDTTEISEKYYNETYGKDSTGI